MKKIMLLLLAGWLSTGWVMSQEVQGVCGTSFEDQLLDEARLLANIEKVNSGAVTNRGAVQYVPIHFHLVGDAAGNGKINERFVLDQLCALNTAFASTEIQFYLSPKANQNTLFNYGINATNVYTNQDAWFTMHTQRHPNALNVFIVNEAVSGNPGPGITLAYYNIPRDWVVSRKDKINGQTSNSTLPHEVGHFFSLKHTFYGWDFESFTPSSPTWPIAPAISPLGVPTEKMDGSNCTIAGDYLCDTPPDYNFGFGNNGCVYNGGAKDPMGVLCDPMENNMMGYFNNCNPYLFTPDQQGVMLADLSASSRNYLDNTFAPAATSITTPPDLLVSPTNSTTTMFYDEVYVEWQNLPGATYYLLEFDVINTFSSAFSRLFIVNTNSKLVTTLDPNRNYYWRVRPFNELVTCATARTGTFKTPTTSAVRTIEDLTAWQVAPNPLRNGSAAKIFVQAKNSFEANVRVFDATGRQVYEQTSVQFPAGEHSVDLPLSNLENGIYTVMLQTQEGQVVRKLSVLN